jgi:hypothetical protein
MELLPGTQEYIGVPDFRRDLVQVPMSASCTDGTKAHDECVVLKGHIRTLCSPFAAKKKELEH